MPQPIEEVLATCLGDIAAGRSTIDECVAQHPAVAAELEPLLRLATAMPKTPWVDPPAELRDRGRTWLMEQIAAQAAPRPWLRWRPFRRRRLAVALAACAADLAAGSATPEQCAARFPDLARDLVSLLSIAAAIRPSADGSASDGFRARGRRELLATIDPIPAYRRALRPRGGGRRNLPVILAACVDDITAGRMSMRGCLLAHPKEAHELGPLLHAALALPPVANIAPTPAFRQQARQELLAQIMQAPQPTGFWRWRQFIAHVRAIPFALVLIAGSGGAVYAAQDSLPGQALYPVKTATEQLRVLTAPSNQARAQALMSVADHRVEELQQLPPTTDPHVVAALVKSYTSATQQAAQLTHDGALPPAATTTLLKREAALNTVVQTLPPSDRAAVAEARDVAQQSAHAAPPSEGPVVRQTPTPAPRHVRRPATIAMATPIRPTAAATAAPTQAAAPSPPATGGLETATPALPPLSVDAPVPPTATIRPTATVPPPTPTTPPPPTATAFPTRPPLFVPPPAPTSTPTRVPPTATATTTFTATPTRTATATATATATRQPSPTGTAIVTASGTALPKPTETPTHGATKG